MEARMKNVTEYWDAVQLRVCGHCIDGDRRGTCRLAGNTECGLKRHFPAIVDSILSVKSDNYGPYVRALRENVCLVCGHQTVGGTCLIRTEVDCGLDRYFPMVVETIESVGSRTVDAPTRYEGLQ